MNAFRFVAVSEADAISQASEAYNHLPALRPVIVDVAENEAEMIAAAEAFKAGTSRVLKICPLMD